MEWGWGRHTGKGTGANVNGRDDRFLVQALSGAKLKYLAPDTAPARQGLARAEAREGHVPAEAEGQLPALAGGQGRHQLLAHARAQGGARDRRARGARGGRHARGLGRVLVRGRALGRSRGEAPVVPKGVPDGPPPRAPVRAQPCVERLHRRHVDLPSVAKHTRKAKTRLSTATRTRARWDHEPEPTHSQEHI